MEKLVHSRIGAREMILTFSLCVLAQAGDRAGDSPQIENWTEWEVPPAKVLSPSEELDSFEIADGFVVDLIASEPLIVDPVAAAFDEKGLQARRLSTTSEPSRFISSSSSARAPMTR